MRQDQITLQQFQLLIRYTGLGQFAKAGIDTVSRITFGDDLADGIGGRINRCIGRRRQFHGLRLAPDRAQIGQAELARLNFETGSHGFLSFYLLWSGAELQRHPASE